MVCVNGQTIYSLCGCQLNISGNKNSFYAKNIWQALSYSYITVGVGYLCYYTSPRQSRGRVLITKISYDYCDITGLFPT